MNDFGFLSLVPPLVTIFIAIYTRNVILSLAIGGLSGALIIASFDPLKAILYFVGDKLFGQISEPANNQVIVTIAVIGGFIKLIEESGGAQAFARNMTKFVPTPVRAQMATYMGGLIIFFTDTGTSLILGPLFAPIYRKLGICKEKLAYILDSTASPVCILIPFISWGAYIMSLIESTYKDMGVEANPLSVLLGAMPFQIYSFLTLLSVPFIIFMKKDFGPMLTAQKDYSEQEHMFEDAPKVKFEKESSLAAIGIPLTTLVGFLAFFMIYFFMTSDKGLSSTNIRSSLFISYGLAALSSALYMKKKFQQAFSDSLSQFIKGGQGMMLIFYILILAWSLSSVCKDLHTGQYIASLMEGFVSASFFPVIVFLLGACISFSLGTSYGTFAILMPIALPVAASMDVSLLVTLGAVLSGGLFGDHTSPISDTTVIASMGASCEHMHHVNTQLYYSLVTGGVSVLVIFLAALTESPFILIPGAFIQFIVLFIVMRKWGKSSL